MQMKNHDEINIAYFILKEYVDTGTEISLSKLMELLYFVNVWSIVTKQNIANMQFVKKKFGPFLAEVYSVFYSADKKLSLPLLDNIQSLNPKDKKFIEFIIASYGKFDDVTLFGMIKQDQPWKETKFEKTIKNEKIYSFYSKLNFAKNFPIHHRRKFYPVETDLHYSFILDFKTESNLPSIVYSTFKEYLTLEKNAEKEFMKNFGKWFDK